MSFKEEQRIDYSRMNVDELITHLFDDQQNLLANTAPSLFNYLISTTTTNDLFNQKVKVILESLVELNRVLKAHFDNENLFFKEYLENTFRLTRQDLQSSLDQLRFEHTLIKKRLNNIRNKCDNYVISSSISSGLKLLYAKLFNIEQDIHKHIFIQEDMLFLKLTNFD